MTKFYSILACLATCLLFSNCSKSSKRIDEITLFPVQAGNQFEYINQDGKIAINPQFSYATVFREDLALVQSSGTNPQWGFINLKGQYVIPARYKAATVFEEGLAWVISANSAPSAINTTGEVKFSLSNAHDVRSYSEGLAAFTEQSENGPSKWGFVDKNGAIKINAQFADVGFFHEGKCNVCNDDGKWGYIDKDGKLIINNQFDSADAFTDGKATVAFGGKWGVIDEKGKYVINPQFQNIKSDADLYLIEQDGKFGWADQDGKITINPQFSLASRFLNCDYAAVKTSDNWGYIDKNGKLVINPQFSYAYPFNGKIALVVNASKVGFIDKNGKYAINPQFDGVSLDFVSFEAGFSANGIVTTDYFNISPTLDRLKNAIKENTIEGISFDTPLQTIFTKYNIPGLVDTYFSVSNQQAPLISGERISKDVRLDLKLGVVPITQQPEIEEFIYTITLSGDAFNKTDILINALENAFAGYTKDTEHSNANFIELKGNSQAINLVKSTGTIEIMIEKLKTQQDFNQMPGD